MESKCFSCKNKKVKTIYGYTVCNYSGSECRNFELYDPIKRTNADNFRAMTDEELAEFLLNRDLAIVENASKAVGFTYKVDRELCLANVIDWLRQECE